MQPKINPIIINKLNSDNSEIILTAIHEIRNLGNYKYIKPLADKLQESDDAAIRQAILEIFNDLTDLEAAEAVVEIITDDKYQSIRKEIVSSCWQNRIDFSKYFSVFLQILIHEPIEISIEAFSVLDEMESIISRELFTNANEQLKDALLTTRSEKSAIIKELMKSFNEKLANTE